MTNVRPPLDLSPGTVPDPGIDALVERFLAHHVAFHPVDATFMGLPGGDDRLPPADAETPARERDALDAIRRALDGVAVADSPGARLDAKLLRAALAHALAALDHRPRFRQPSWYTGEVAFGLVSLLLPSAPTGATEAFAARLAAIPDFLAAGARHLAGQPTPPDWATRAKREIAAIRCLLAPWRERHPASIARAEAALASFTTALDSLPPGDPACGRDYLAFLMREIHALPWSIDDAVARAEEAFARLGERPVDASPSLEPAALPAAYRDWHERALESAGALVTPARDYGLEFRPQPDWARPGAADLYFLAYRSPPATSAGTSSVYWTAPAPQPLVAVKQTHAVHHGSIGHHTQNARARVAPSRLARIAGTDCASGIALLGAGTMVEGWACYATNLMAEVDGFYTGAERAALVAGDRRNAASVLADIKLHTGEWSLERMRAFYRDEAGFPASRIERETTRNSIFPATRLMYFLGVEQIVALRRELGGDPRALHDSLLACGHVPVAWAAEEVRRELGAGSTP